MKAHRRENNGPKHANEKLNGDLLNLMKRLCFLFWRKRSRLD
jgi:hypothetical protein